MTSAAVNLSNKQCVGVFVSLPGPRAPKRVARQRRLQKQHESPEAGDAHPLRIGKSLRRRSRSKGTHCRSRAHVTATHPPPLATPRRARDDQGRAGGGKPRPRRHCPLYQYHVTIPGHRSAVLHALSGREPYERNDRSFVVFFEPRTNTRATGRPCFTHFPDET